MPSTDAREATGIVVHPSSFGSCRDAPVIGRVDGPQPPALYQFVVIRTRFQGQIRERSTRHQLELTTQAFRSAHKSFQNSLNP
jgi:hypothetical protein